MGFVEAVCISQRKGVAKRPVAEAKFIADWGIEADAHAGSWERQVSLLSGESVDRMKDKLPQLEKGAFAENIMTRGLDLKTIEIGDRLRVGDHVILEVTQIGKECHMACEIGKRIGDCLMSGEGIFARVRQGGLVKPGDRIEKST